MSDEPSNVASDYLRNALTTARGSPSEKRLRAGLTDDFTFEDRRSGPSFPDADADSYPKIIESIWRTGTDGQPRVEAETLAVRGERFAAVAARLDYGNGMLTESIHVIGLDATLSCCDARSTSIATTSMERSPNWIAYKVKATRSERGPRWLKGYWRAPGWPYALTRGIMRGRLWRGVATLPSVSL